MVINVNINNRTDNDVNLYDIFLLNPIESSFKNILINLDKSEGNKSLSAYYAQEFSFYYYLYQPYFNEVFKQKLEDSFDDFIKDKRLATIVIKDYSFYLANPLSVISSNLFQWQDALAKHNMVESFKLSRETMFIYHVTKNLIEPYYLDQIEPSINFFSKKSYYNFESTELDLIH